MFWVVNIVLPLVASLLISVHAVGYHEPRQQSYYGYNGNQYMRPAPAYRPSDQGDQMSKLSNIGSAEMEELFARLPGPNEAARKSNGYTQEPANGRSGYGSYNNYRPYNPNYIGRFGSTPQVPYTYYAEPPPSPPPKLRPFAYSSGIWANRPSYYGNTYYAPPSLYYKPPPPERFPLSYRPQPLNQIRPTYQQSALYKPYSSYGDENAAPPPPPVYEPPPPPPPVYEPSPHPRPLPRPLYGLRPPLNYGYGNAAPPPTPPPPPPPVYEPPPPVYEPPPPVYEPPPPVYELSPPPPPSPRPLFSWRPPPSSSGSTSKPPIAAVQSQPTPPSNGKPVTYYTIGPDGKLVPGTQDLSHLISFSAGMPPPSAAGRKPGVVTSSELGGVTLTDDDDPFKPGSGWNIGGESKPPPSPVTRPNRKPNGVLSNQLQGVSFNDADWLQSSSANQRGGQAKPRPRVDAVPMITMQELDKRMMSPEEYEEKYPPSQGDLTMLGKITTDPLGKEHLSTYEGVTKHIKLEPRKVSAYNTSFNDPSWNNQWYLHDYRTTEMPVMDLNVVPVWNMGITGKGVYVAVVDDGVMHDHPDLAANHNKELSFDYNQRIKGSHPDEPQVREGMAPDMMMHGTECAGVIAMVANNGVCGVGVAHRATIIGVKVLGVIRMLKRGEILDTATSYEDGKGLVHRMDIVDISSNSYGSKSNGKYPQYISGTKEKFLNMGIREGRNGNGTIYTVASGNGAGSHDVCGADAVVNQLAMIAISAVDYRGKITYFAERCSAVFAATYSQGHKSIDVSAIDSAGCTSTFTGTSASVPLASGMLALAVEAAKQKGKTLTYRDMMHIIAMGSEVAPLADNMDLRTGNSVWKRNAAGFWVCNDFGFGLLNAKNMVKLAQEWQNVGEMHSCDIAVPLKEKKVSSVDNPATIEFQVSGCKVKWLEAVRLKATLHADYRGAFDITLTSPAGTTATVMESRQYDDNKDMLGWTFKSVHTWGENPEGTWKIQVISTKLWGKPDKIGYAVAFRFMAHGLADPPPHQHKLPRTYSAFRLADGRTSHDHVK